MFGTEMWKSTVLCLTLVFTSLCIYAEKHMDQSSKPKQEEDLNKATGDTGMTSHPANDRPREQTDLRVPQEFNPLLGYRLSSSTEQKRGKNFGFVGSRGRRGETFADAVQSQEFPLSQPTELKARLRMLLGKHHQGLFAKEKRKPHFGFHGSRG